MANLIITIISIALVAVAALMGAYYGGTAFLQGQGKAYANAIIGQGEQLVAAWSIFAADRGGSWSDLSDLATLSVSTSGPAYLSSLPVSPSAVTSSTALSVWTLENLSDTSLSTGLNGVYVRLQDNGSGLNVCNLIAQAVAGSTAVPSFISVTASTNLMGSTGRKFDCVGHSSTLTAVTTSTPKYVYYRAF
jgi:hypothetical protein